jgi:hypothetical protein
VLSPLRSEGGHLPFIDQGEGHCLATCGGMAYSAAELAAVLAVLAPVLSSRRVRYLNRGGFEGEGIVVGRGVFRRARGSR